MLSQLECIAKICNSNTVTEAFVNYISFQSELEDYKFILASDKGPTPGHAINKTFSAGAAIRSLFKTEHVIVLDPITLEEMAKGSSIFQIDYSISLDSSAFSYIEPFISTTANKSRIPSDFIEVFNFIARDDVFIDPLPYSIENHNNLKNSTDIIKTYKKLMAYEVLRTIDNQWLQKYGQVKSILSEFEIKQNVDAHLSQILKNSTNNNMRNIYDLEYLCLLEMVIIQFSHQNKSIKTKLDYFLNFLDTKLATICIRESIIAYNYFRNTTKLSFFKKIHKGHPSILNNLKNMAWDLFHIRHLEAFTTIGSENIRYFFPAFLTFDKGLIEIINLCSLKAIAFNKGTLLPFYEQNPLHDIEFIDFQEKYFSSRARYSRSERMVMQDGYLIDLINNLEGELHSLSH